MTKNLFQKARYNDPGHAHELTFSCYMGRESFNDNELCEMYLSQLLKAKSKHHYLIWAYVLMPDHVHLLLWPRIAKYDMAKIQKDINGPVSRLYSKHLQEKSLEKWKEFQVQSKSRVVFRLFQAGGGYDRNMRSADAVHKAIVYIENNPVKAGLVKNPHEWRWSSAYARHTGIGLVPDSEGIPVLCS